MRRWTVIDQAPVPGGGALDLLQGGDAFLIRVDGQELMTSRMSGSEVALAELALEGVADRRGLRVLVGGLGMGFSAAAVLQRVPADAQVVVAEIVPAVVRWNRGVLGAVAGHPLDDARCSVFEGDVARAMAQGGWHAILLDVDNGPDGLSRPGNDRLYSARGLKAARQALAPGGVLGVWSAHPSDPFTRRLEQAGFVAGVESVRGGGRSGPRHTIWLARPRS